MIKKHIGVCSRCNRESVMLANRRKAIGVCCYQSYRQERKQSSAKTSKPRTPIRKISSKQSKLNREYSQVRKAFLIVNPKCRVFPTERATQVHHTMGRRGYADDYARENDISLTVDIRYFLAVSEKGHTWIHKNPRKAAENGWLKLKSK